MQEQESKQIILSLAEVLQSDTADIQAARARCGALCRTKDIRAGGDEVEMAVRTVLSKKLGINYHVGHGHIVDTNSSTSPQLDVIIADMSAVGALFQGTNGTEYFPFESIYAFGEIKSTYYKSENYLDNFVEKIKRIKTQLTREEVPANYVRIGTTGMNFAEIFTLGRSGIQNKLFTFMIIADSGDFEPAHLEKFYNETSPEDLPNFVCILNRGIIAFTQFTADEKIDRHEPNQLLVLQKEKLKSSSTLSRPTFIEFAPETPFRDGINLGVALSLLDAHLSTCTLMPPQPLAYYTKLLQGVKRSGYIYGSCERQPADNPDVLPVQK
ncbi:MAG: hypothetical protein K2X29_01500 [Candidatus Obscuribacterales bacterium]|nr:hypothetical protein [Candidatus Obscuribacterales bacterium]